MTHKYLPLFVEPSYSSSPWFKETLAGIEDEASRHKIEVKTFIESIEQVDIHALPSVVTLASRSRSYLNAMIDHMENHSKKSILAGVDSGYFGENISSATVSRTAETIRLISYMYSCGRSKIALFGLDQISNNDMVRYSAVFNAASNYDFHIEPEDVYFNNGSLSECFDLFMERSSQYNAVICPNDIVAICFMQFARNKGIRVPEDIFVGSFGNFHCSRLCNPSLTTFSIDFYEIGVQIVNSWIFLMENPHIASMKITTPSKLIIRESTASLEENNYVHRVFEQPAQADRYYQDPLLSKAFDIENCMSLRDALDMKIINGIMQHKVYEHISEELFISTSALRYRVSKMYQDARVDNKTEFIKLLEQYLFW
ncbi:LacI family DNA-binding transcriptional regulator [Cohnella panacarvi]|uniref:substrate-binding domain-containing protein n=1 Tax=Cohnella panacarvi TaxID=400776 RepID=UPI000478F842|nr:LacI family DNA-binding transcriptional regulator [Cohnella panacarvi]